MRELPKKYDSVETEKKWQEYWEKEGIYRWDENISRDDSYVIDTPPPTVSGHLHIGHIFSYTQADYIARYKRMKGFNVFYPMGFDDNGLPTERLVEKTKKTKAFKHSREDFNQMCTEVGEQARKDFRQLFTSTALSVDWSQEYHTVSEDVMKISQMSFLDLYKKKQVYRKLQPMFWDPVDQTAIAQAEVEEHELPSFENYIYFGLISEEQKKAHDGGKKFEWEDIKKVEIMTTRPEMLPACVALMIHPDDIKKYEGYHAVTPLFQKIVPIVADEDVQKDKGTGVVMCCTFGDEQDIRWWQKHNLDLKVILNKFGKLDLEDDSIAFHDEINGKKVDHQEEKFSARKTVIKLLEENNLTAKEKEPIKHMVKCAERSGSPLEIIPTQQWFIKVMEHKEELKKKANECVWYPSHMSKRVDQWIDSLSWDWCISRQRYFGVPFPVWYVTDAETKTKNFTVVAEAKDLPADPLAYRPRGFIKNSDGTVEDPSGKSGYSATAGQDIFDENGDLIYKTGEFVIIKPEADVMDTWATSSVSPQINSHGITDEFATNIQRHKNLFPADLRPQAHEIIRTWAFYTIAKSYLHENTIPWKNLMISGWCLAEDKSKMSKSKGNIVKPEDILKENSADVIRYWSSTSKLGSDTAFSPDVLKIGKKLTNKLWNATKFAALHFNLIEGKPSTAKKDIENGIIFEATDKWIISQAYRTVVKATEEFEIYEYSLARKRVEEFFWNFCDNYLEAVKKRTYDEDKNNEKSRLSALYTIHHCLETFLKLFAPFLPHLTEELYSHIFDQKHMEIKSIHSKNTWPDATDYSLDTEAEKQGELLVLILDYVRRFKADKNISIKFPLKEISIQTSSDNIEAIRKIEDDLLNVTNTESLNFESVADKIYEGLEVLEIDEQEISVQTILGEKEEAA